MVQTHRMSFVSTLEDRNGSGLKDGYMQNFYVDKPGGREVQAVKRAGLKVYDLIAQHTGVGRGIFQMNRPSAGGTFLSVVGNKLYINGNEAKTLTTSTGRCYFSSNNNGTIIGLMDGAKLYKITESNTVTEVTLPFTPVVGLTYLDGYFLTSDSNDVYSSDLENIDSWNALSFVTPNQYPGKIMGLRRHSNYVAVFKANSLEFLYDAAISAPASAFAPVPNVVHHIGCFSGNSIALFEDIGIYVTTDNTGEPSIMMLQGVNVEKISTASVERTLKDHIIYDCHAVIFRESGHIFYSLRCNGFSLVFDLTTKLWDKWTTVYDSGMAAFGGHYSAGEGVVYLQDSTTGIVYKFDKYYYKDSTNVIQCQVITDLFDGGNNKYKFLRYLDIIADKTTTNLQLSFTDNDYNTYSSSYTCPLQYGRVTINRLGQFRRRAFKVVHTDDTPLRLEAMEMVLDLGSS
ncbi:Bacteriophage P22, Gp10, DNA-stabilising [uncultured Caudovirales phage]|uniref:Bacteriophage P22, Gp10, DNA-stabilising n=1 Tax=uncultured Caudovirales phage TaxID=2100421 RepID=A0A6J5TAM1_9CAUD|nr:Bacteriophage P22, Gp10, DNA-stabilising [uncultured Caudovirales phage]